MFNIYIIYLHTHELDDIKEWARSDDNEQDIKNEEHMAPGL